MSILCICHALEKKKSPFICTINIYGMPLLFSRGENSAEWVSVGAPSRSPLRSAIISCDLAAPSAIPQALGDNELPVEGTRSGYAAGAAGGRSSVSAKGGPGEGKLKLGLLLKLPTPLRPQTGPCAARSPGLAVPPRRAAPPTPPCPRGPRPQPPEPRRTHSISCQPGSLAPSPPRVEASCSQSRADPVPAARSASASDCWAPSPAEANLPWILCPRPRALQALLSHGLCLLMLSRTRLKRLSMRACGAFACHFPQGFPTQVGSRPIPWLLQRWPLNPYNCSRPDGRCLAQEVSALPNLPSASGPGSVTHPQKPGPVTPDGTPLVTAEPSRAPRDDPGEPRG